MKVNVSQVQNGLTKYLDAEFMQKLNGLQKWLFGAAASMLLANFGKTFNALKTNPIISVMGVIDAEDRLDIDEVYRYFKAEARKSPASFELPGIGMVTLTEQDVDKLYGYIVNS